MKIEIEITADDYIELSQDGENTISLGLLLDLRNAVRNGKVIEK